MALTFTRDLDPLTSSGLELDDPSRDLRGRDVVDENARDDRHRGRDADRPAACASPACWCWRPAAACWEWARSSTWCRWRRSKPMAARCASMDQGRDHATSRNISLADGEEEELQYVQVYAAYGIRPYWEVEAESPSATTRRAENAARPILRACDGAPPGAPSACPSPGPRRPGATLRPARRRQPSRRWASCQPRWRRACPRSSRRCTSSPPATDAGRQRLPAADPERAWHARRTSRPRWSGSRPSPSAFNDVPTCSLRDDVAMAHGHSPSSSQRSSSRAPGSACGSWLSDS